MGDFYYDQTSCALFKPGIPREGHAAIMRVALRPCHPGVVNRMEVG